MTAPGAPGQVRDFTDQQRALVTIARLHLGLTPDDLAALLAVAIPDAPPDRRAARYAQVQLAVSRYDDLCCGELDATAFLGAREPGDDSDEDDRVHFAVVMAWFEVTEAVLRAAPAVSVDEHAQQMIDALTAPKRPEQVAA